MAIQKNDTYVICHDCDNLYFFDLTMTCQNPKKIRFSLSILQKRVNTFRALRSREKRNLFEHSAIMDD